MEKILTLHNLSFAYNEKEILKDISFDINSGEHLCILGANGSGKTTLLKCIAGIIKSDQIEYYIDNNQIFFLPTDFELFDYLTMDETIEYILKVNNRYTELDTINLYIDRFKLGSYRNELIVNLSFGTKSKIAMMISFLIKPKVLIIDEPFTGFDDYSINESLKIIKYELNSEITFIISTHRKELLDELNFKVIKIDY